MLRIVLAVLGYIIALGVNIFVPSISGIEFQEHQIFSITVNSNDLYRFLLIAIIAVYVITGFVSLKNKEKKKKFKKKIPFRIAVGIALAVWDVAGTKLAILPQPFFPGPAGIAEAFLEDGMYVLENTLYSIRLFAVGFSIGVISGIITGVVTGYFPKIAYWINPILDICGVIPP
ncbi:MAG: ABC transporter permease, partial [Eubacterium sp.]|nr:ABC transporter permease [Eubacterium sp.]